MSEGVGFGNYRLLRRIARGGMAEVFLARQQGVEGFERRVAIKRILPHLSDSAEFRTMFLDEARLAAQLSHPNIIHIYDFGKVDDYYFIAMEYVDGVDFGRLIKQARTSPVPFELIARLLSDVCAGLHYAHNISDGEGKRLNVVHRDVTPQNVLATYDGVVKVVDFGIAKATWQASRTRPGVVKGKYAYMSPEQVEGRQLDARSDIFSVGICMYELMTGMPLFRRDNVTESMKEIRDGKPIHPEHHRTDIPHELMMVLRRALETSRDARYPTAAAMQLDLERYLKNATELATPQLLGEFLRREAPPIVSGELMGEPKSEPSQPSEPVPPPQQTAGTAEMSSVKQAVTPAYDSLAALAGSAPAAGSDTSGPRAELTTPGRPVRPVTSPGFADPGDDDLTRRDDRPPATSHNLQTVRSQKYSEPYESIEAQRPTEKTMPSASQDRPRTSQQQAAQPRSGQERAQGGSRSGPFPGKPLGSDAMREISASQDSINDETKERGNPPPHAPPPHTIWPWALVVVALLASGAALVLGPQAWRTRIGLGAQATTDKPVLRVDELKVDPPKVTAASDAGLQVVTTELPVQTSAILGINTRPSGAKIFIDGEALEMLTPVRTQPVTAGPHHMVIERVGYAPREEDITLHAGEHRVFDYELQEEHSLQTPKHHSSSGSASSSTHSAGNGFLTAKTVPWSRAYDGETLLGETPIVNVPLSEGTHTISFVNPDLPPVKKRITVKVGEETKLNFSLGGE